MGFSGTHTYEHDIQRVWDTLMDPQAIAQALPGKAQLLAIPEQRLAWQVTTTLSLAGMSTHVSGIVRLDVIETLVRYALYIEGDGLQNDLVHGQAEISLSADSSASAPLTVVNWQAEFAGASMGSFMARIISPVVVAASRRFFTQIETLLNSDKSS